MSEEPLTEGRRKVLQKLNALPEDRRRTARRMIVVVLASFGICAASLGTRDRIAHAAMLACGWAGGKFAGRLGLGRRFRDRERGRLWLLVGS